MFFSTDCICFFIRKKFGDPGLFGLPGRRPEQDDFILKAKQKFFPVL